jgi:two-component system chemotaxis response regulator CheB
MVDAAAAETSGGQRPPWLIILAASAGGVQALRTIVGGLPSGLPAAVLVVLHRPAGHTSYLRELLETCSPLPVVDAQDGDAISGGVVYVARTDAHLTVTGDERLLHQNGRQIRFTRSGANLLLETAAATFGERVIAVVLTGGGSDATDGVQAVKASGGVVLAQDEASSELWGMPRAAIDTGAVDYVLPLDGIAPVLEAIVRGEPVREDGRTSAHGAA